MTCSVLPRGLRRPLAGLQTAGQHSAGTLPAWGAGILPPAHRHWPRAAHALCLSLPICKMVVITVPIGSGHSENCMFSQNEVLGAPCMLGERGVLLLRRSCGCLAASHSGGRDFVRTDAGSCRRPAVWPLSAWSSSGCERPCPRPDSAVLGGLRAGAGADLGELPDPILGLGQLRSTLVAQTQSHTKCKQRT